VYQLCAAAQDAIIQITTLRMRMGSIAVAQCAIDYRGNLERTRHRDYK
jgi:hypothetical protein